jgi:hypothetical protein
MKTHKMRSSGSQMMMGRKLHELQSSTMLFEGDERRWKGFDPVLFCGKWFVLHLKSAVLHEPPDEGKH